MDQKIEAPNDADIDRIARMLINAKLLAQEIISEELDATLQDLDRLQRIVDTGSIQPEATFQLQSLGLAFGKIFVENNPGYDWWMVEDEYGRDPCVRYKETTLLSFPQTMLSKRIEDGEALDVADLYAGVVDMLEKIRIRDFGDA